MLLRQITRTQKEFVKIFSNKNLREYHNLCVQRNTLVLADVFDNFQSMCLKICELDPTCFLTAPGLVRQATLKKTKVK